VWAGWDSVREQEKLEARKMPVNRADSHPSAARFVGRFYLLSDSLAFTRRSAKNLGNDPGDFGCFSNLSKISSHLTVYSA